MSAAPHPVFRLLNDLAAGEPFKGLGPQHRLLLVLIADRVGHNEHTWASTADFTARLGYQPKSEKQVRSMLDDLELRQLITIERRPGRSHRIRFHPWHPLQNPGSTDLGDKVAPGPQTRTPRVHRPGDPGFTDPTNHPQPSHERSEWEEVGVSDDTRPGGAGTGSPPPNTLTADQVVEAVGVERKTNTLNAARSLIAAGLHAGHLDGLRAELHAKGIKDPTGVFITRGKQAKKLVVDDWLPPPPKPPDPALTCTTCEFVAKNPQGLQAHRRSHERQAERERKFALLQAEWARKATYQAHGLDSAEDFDWWPQPLAHPEPLGPSTQLLKVAAIWHHINMNGSPDVGDIPLGHTWKLIAADETTVTVALEWRPKNIEFTKRIIAGAIAYRTSDEDGIEAALELEPRFLLQTPSSSPARRSSPNG